MRKPQRLLIAIITLMAVLYFGSIGVAKSSQPTVQLTVGSAGGQLFPFEAEAATSQFPAGLTLQALDEAGQPLQNAKIHLTILTPPKNTWFPTDFPLVEGTKLLDIESIAPRGKMQVQQMLPIQGKYQLLVNVTPIVENQFTPFDRKLTLYVPENPLEWVNLGILAWILLLVGLGGGWVIGGKEEILPGAIVPARVRLLVSGVAVAAIATLLLVNISAELAESHSHEHNRYREVSLSAHQSEIIDSTGIKLLIAGDTDAKVGQVANFEIQAIDPKKDRPVTDLNFKIKTIHQESKWVAFAYNGKTDINGKFAWQQQFFDGAPHKVEVEFAPQNDATEFVPLRVTRAIEVEGAAPPLSVRLIPLTYCTGIIAIGLILGLQLRKLPLEKLN